MNNNNPQHTVTAQFPPLRDKQSHMTLSAMPEMTTERDDCFQCWGNSLK